ncbi:hypothetical protein M9H77_17134 [Catharanthus roseus]|uniref:Uncharacterized protein n=1 Tax=Catharanthus roseus TaxID=4058 RepID=A0ACC0B3S8_CATRO|nr:hypothetical protein M9H77_17134 [Catharanthus roseus]
MTSIQVIAGSKTPSSESFLDQDINLKTTTSKVSKTISKKGSKVATANQGSSSSLDVRIICSKDNLRLGGWKYSKGGCSILFSNVDSAELIKVMKRHLRANDVSISYDPDDDSELCESGAFMYPSTICYSSLGSIRKEFFVPTWLGLRAASANERAHIMPPENMDGDELPFAELLQQSGNRKRTEGIMPLIQEEQMLLRMEEEEEIPLAEVRRDNFPEFVEGGQELVGQPLDMPEQTYEPVNNQDRDQECSTTEGRPKTDIPNTLSMNAQGSRDYTSRLYIELSGSDQEYLNIPLLQVLKHHRMFSFERFLAMVKVYLGLHGGGGVVQLELDVHDLCYKLDIRHGHFKETARNVVAPQEAIDLFERVFERPFERNRRCSPNFRRFLTLDVLIKKEEEDLKRKRAAGEAPAEWGYLLGLQSLHIRIVKLETFSNCTLENSETINCTHVKYLCILSFFASKISATCPKTTCKSLQTRRCRTVAFFWPMQNITHIVNRFHMIIRGSSDSYCIKTGLPIFEKSSSYFPFTRKSDVRF